MRCSTDCVATRRDPVTETTQEVSAKHDKGDRGHAQIALDDICVPFITEGCRPVFRRNSPCLEVQALEDGGEREGFYNLQILNCQDAMNATVAARPCSFLPAESRRGHSDNQFTEVRVPIRMTRGAVIAVGRSHEPPEFVVSVCTALVLNMLYTSKNPMTRTAFGVTSFPVPRATSWPMSR